MKPSEIAQSIELCMNAGLNPFIWGPPGVGKTELIHQLARSRDLELRVFHNSQRDPVDFSGIPYADDERITRNGALPTGRKVTHWATPSFLPTSGRGIMFFDEYSQGTHAVMNATSQILLERRLGDWTMPEGWCAIAASNNQSDRAATNRLPTHIASRFVHLEFEVDLDEWTKHAMSKDFAFEVRAFLRLKAELLHKFDPRGDAKTFPCPRTWEFTSRIFKQRPPESLEMALYSGAVGQGAATEFLAFLRVYKNLPSPDGIIANPDAGTIPDKPEVMYALCGTLARKANPSNWASIARYVDRLSPEFGVCLVTEAAKRCPDIQNTKAFIAWAAKNSDVVI